MPDFSELFNLMIGGPSSRLWPLYLPGMFLLALIIYYRQHHTGGFLKWLFPRSIYLHKSHLVDIQLFAFGRLLSLLGILQKITVTVAVTTGIMAVLGGKIAFDVHLSPFVIGALLFVAGDFSTYWVHRVHHEHPTLWPFHAVHHSAEVMTPITAYRKHPIYDLFSQLVRGLILGVAQGVLLSFFVSEISITLLFGVNIFYVAFNAVTGNLRHSHVWLSFGRVMEHILISPAQHQIHHSVELKHYNRNYGEVLAIWDWMFGTLYVTAAKREELCFGLGDKNGNPIAQIHPTLAAALILPVRQSLASLRRRKTPSAEPQQVTPAE